MYRGREILVDIRSSTWTMFSKCFKCLNASSSDEPRNLIITTSPIHSASVAQLSVTLPHYSLSFFVNEMEELESHDFKQMVYDEDQCAGTLFGLENILILQPSRTLVPRTLIPRRVLIPNSKPTMHGDHQVQIKTPNSYSNAPRNAGPLYHTYIVDTELGCLVGNGGLASTEFLARLHAMTSWHRPDSLTGKTGAQAALCLLQSAGCRSIMKLKALNNSDSWTQYPQIKAAYEELKKSRYYWNRDPFRRKETSAQEKITAQRAAQRVAQLKRKGDADSAAADSAAAEWATQWAEQGAEQGAREWAREWAAQRAAQRAAYLFPSNATQAVGSPEDRKYNGRDHLTTSAPSEPALPLTLSHPVLSLQYIFNAGSPTQITLDYLMWKRSESAPKLPARVTLLRNSGTSSSDDISALDQIFSHFQTHHSFHQKYLTQLDASAQHVHTESRRTHSVAGENRIVALTEHHMQCLFAYLRSLEILKQSLGPTTAPYEQAHIQFGEWPPITADDLLQYLASTSPIKIPPGWKQCLTSLALLLLDLQRSRRLLRFAMEGLEEDLSKELENEGCDGWKPDEYPDWLLIQVGFSV